MKQRKKIIAPDLKIPRFTGWREAVEWFFLDRDPHNLDGAPDGYYFPYPDDEPYEGQTDFVFPLDTRECTKKLDPKPLRLKPHIVLFLRNIVIATWFFVYAHFKEVDLFMWIGLLIYGAGAVELVAGAFRLLALRRDERTEKSDIATT